MTDEKVPGLAQRNTYPWVDRNTPSTEWVESAARNSMTISATPGALIYQGTGGVDVRADEVMVFEIKDRQGNNIHEIVIREGDGVTMKLVNGNIEIRRLK